MPTTEHHLGVAVITCKASHKSHTHHAEPATTPWGLSISDSDFEKLKAGFEPQDHDDK